MTRACSEIILCMGPANERRRYIVTSSLIGRAQTQNDPWLFILQSQATGWWWPSDARSQGISPPYLPAPCPGTTELYLCHRYTASHHLTSQSLVQVPLSFTYVAGTQHLTILPPSPLSVYHWALLISQLHSNWPPYLPVPCPGTTELY